MVFLRYHSENPVALLMIVTALAVDALLGCRVRL